MTGYQVTRVSSSDRQITKVSVTLYVVLERNVIDFFRTCVSRVSADFEDWQNVARSLERRYMS